MSSEPKEALSLFDGTCLIVGIIIGAGIYETAPTVAAGMGGWGGTLAIWIFGGALALCGALCYAELANTYPNQGGDVVYLSRAYGPWAGFLFGWSQMVVIRPADIALMAYIFAHYASTLYAPFAHPVPVYAGAVVTLLTIINILGVRESKWTQNILTMVKISGLLLIAVIGLMAPGTANGAGVGRFSSHGLKLGLILVLYTYGGWNEMAYVAAEIRHPRKNIVRILVLGTATVTLLYLLINATFLWALGYAGMSGSSAVAVDAVATVMPAAATRLIAAVICISALGAANGLIFSGSRISYALGAGYGIFHRLGAWHPRLGTPVAALVLQGLISLLIVLLAGSFIDTIVYSAPAVWLFFLGSAISLFVLRRKDAGREHPFKVPGYPALPAVFASTCAFMLCGSTIYAMEQRPSGLLTLLMVLGFGAFLSRRA